ncbi:MAG TPA: hypothetical protein VFK52_07065 [Nocardioidaceae bacterium]|nr:hypothetical protein [Nocardioidaceae bacterium]
MSLDAFTNACREAESLIRGASFIKTDRDLADGLDYLAGSIRASLSLAWAYDVERPFFVNSTNQFTKMGLDNPDTVYYHAYVRAGHTYVVRGRRGTTVDLSFQLLNGDYTPSSTPDGSVAFDDRSLTIEEDGSFELRFDDLPEGAAMLAVREVYDDWSAQRGTITIERTDTIGTSPAQGLSEEALAKRYAVAGKMLLGRIKTWFVFPEWFYLNEPVNTITAPRPTPGGLSSQYSSVGHYDVADNEAIVLTVPRGDAPYLGFQLGTPWYTSLDYINHQTSLNGHQAQVDPDGMIRIVVSEQNPGVANWVERLGHDRGYLQFRWQRLDGPVTEGPTLQVVPVASLPDVLPYYDSNTVTPEQWAQRIAARQRGVAGRLIG